MRRRTGACRWLIVPTTQRRSDWRGEKRGASAPKRATSKRGLATLMNSMPQQAVTNGYWNSEYFLAQASNGPIFDVAKPDSLPSSATVRVALTWLALPLQRALAPYVHQSDGDDRQEAHHFDHSGPPERSKVESPWVDENGLDVEDDEENGRQVEFDGELDVPSPRALAPALVRLHLFGRRELLAKYAREREE